MDSGKEKEGDAVAASTEAAASVSQSAQPLAQLPTPPNLRASSPTPSTTSSAGRPPYMPQFSAATQMILKRINSKGSLSSALSSASSVAKASIEKSTFEDAKRRLVMKMNTSLTMPMPMSSSTTSAPSTHNSSSTASTLRMPIQDAFQLRTPAPVKTMAVGKLPTQKASAQKAKAKAQRGTKRKRGRNDDEDDALSSQSDLSDSEGVATVDAAAATKESQAVPTMTKSGRQVQKPSQYNPTQQSARDASNQKRKHYGKRTPEQALCKVCTRGLSPAKNQIVFCDGCNCCWHQLCHDPYIDDDFVSNESRSWFCSRCLAKRERHLAKKKTVESFKGASWAAKSAEQKRSYLSGVQHSQLVNMIMYSTELHPDLPIFPVNEPRRGGTQGVRSSYDSPRIKGDGNINVGPAHYSSKVSTPDPHLVGGIGKGNPKAAADDQAARESSTDSVPPAWPKVGKGCLAGLEMNEDDLRDDNDYEAFSVTTYDSKGNKTMENGMPV
ncbi:hypothetical protein F4818DRAFT_356399 [Hypoxylon cercidicola]|nr:hypothetical protein F4818DRAFT_356399 [Hypoxylon cercidicola]